MSCTKSELNHKSQQIFDHQLFSMFVLLYEVNSDIRWSLLQLSPVTYWLLVHFCTQPQILYFVGLSSRLFGSYTSVEMNFGISRCKNWTIEMCMVYNYLSSMALCIPCRRFSTRIRFFNKQLNNDPLCQKIDKWPVFLRFCRNTVVSNFLRHRVIVKK